MTGEHARDAVRRRGQIFAGCLKVFSSPFSFLVTCGIPAGRTRRVEYQTLAHRAFGGVGGIDRGQHRIGGICGFVSWA